MKWKLCDMPKNCDKQMIISDGPNEPNCTLYLINSFSAGTFEDQNRFCQ